MGFGTAIVSCFRKYAAFGGRARRAEFWYFALFAALMAVLAHVLDKALSHSQDTGAAAALLSLLLFLPSLAVTVRRLHDTNRSGWWFGVFVMYVVGAAMASFMVVMGPAGRGTPGPMGEIVPDVLMGGAALFAVGLLVLLMLKGSGGANRYGEAAG